MGLTRSPAAAVTAVSSRLRPPNNIVALVGHSMQAQALPVTASPRTAYLATTAVPYWASLLSKGRYQFRQDCSFGVSGSLIKDIYNTPISGADTQLSLALKCRAGTVYIHSGHNDAFAGLAWQQSVYGTGDDSKGLNWVIGQLVAAGKTVVVSSEIPSGDASNISRRPTATQLAALLGFRDWVLRTMPGLFPGAAFGVDYWPAMADPASATAGDVKLLYTKDGVHPSTVGAYFMAQQLLPVLDRLGIPQAYPPVAMPGDVYGAGNNQRGNLLTNGVMLASNAMPANTGTTTYSGVRPSGWGFNLNGAAAAATLTITGSQVTNARGQWFQIGLAGTTTASAAPNIQLFQSTLAVPSSGSSPLAAGDTVENFAEIEVDANGTGLYGPPQFDFQRADPAGNDTISWGQNDASQLRIDAILATLAAAPLAGTIGGGLFSTVTGTETTVTPKFQVNLVESASISATIRIRNAALRKVVA